MYYICSFKNKASQLQTHVTSHAHGKMTLRAELWARSAEPWLASTHITTPCLLHLGEMCQHCPWLMPEAA